MGKFLDNFTLYRGDKLSKPLFINFFLLRLTGLWPKGERYSNIFYIIYSAILTSLFGVMNTVLQIYPLRYTYHDVALLSASLYVVSEEVIVTTKVLFIIVKMRQFKELVNDINSELFSPKNDAQLMIIRKFFVMWKFLGFGLAFNAGTATFFWITFTIIDGGVRERRLPFVSWFPYNTTISPNYELTYVYQSLGIIYQATTNISIDLLVSVLMMYTAAQCGVLSDHLRNIYTITEDTLVEERQITDDTDEETRRNLILENMNRTFINLIYFHQRILNLANKTNLLIDPLMMTQFVVTTSALCLTMIQLISTPIFSSEFLALIFYQVAVMFQLLIYSWFGNEVSLQSVNLSYAVYECDWTSAPISFKKHILFFMVRTQRPLKYYALNFFEVSVDTYTKILRSSWSYFAVLRQNDQKNKARMSN